MHKIEMNRGTSETFKVTILDANRAPLALPDGGVVVFGVKKRPTDTEFAIRKTAATLQGGVATFELDPADTMELEAGRYYFDAGVQAGDDYFPAIKPPRPFDLIEGVTKWGDGV